MANFLEKNLPKPIRKELRTLIAAALGLFLGLQYNNFVKKLLSTFLPDSNGNLMLEGLYLLVVTVVIVYVTVFTERALDGK
jgi:hypothetical protein